MSRNNWTDDELIFRLVHNKTDKSRWDSIGVLRKRPSEDLFAKCVELIKSKEGKLRAIGVDILAQLGLPPRPFLTQTLQAYFDLLCIEDDPRVLASVFYAIGHNNDKLGEEQVDKICSFVANENSAVRESLVFALLGIDSPPAIEALIQLSSDKSSGVRNWATFGLGTQIERDSAAVRKALWDRIDDKHQETKLEAIVGLAKRKDSRVNEIIKREIVDGEYGSLLFEAVVETKDKEFLPLLEHNLDKIVGDKTINDEWKNELINCIDQLSATVS